MGFRNEFNVARFLWDVIDGSSGDEDTNSSMIELAQLMADMPCTEAAGSWGNDGNCNEPDRSSAASCYPLSPYGTAFSDVHLLEYGSLAVGTRDTYNPYDFGDMIPESQYSARYVNCVDLAAD
jgi:hypothetical protein